MEGVNELKLNLDKIAVLMAGSPADLKIDVMSGCRHALPEVAAGKLFVPVLMRAHFLALLGSPLGRNNNLVALVFAMGTFCMGNLKRAVHWAAFKDTVETSAGPECGSCCPELAKRII